MTNDEHLHPKNKTNLTLAFATAHAMPRKKYSARKGFANKQSDSVPSQIIFLQSKIIPPPR